MELLCKIREISRSLIEFEAAFQKRYNLCLNEGMLLCTLQSVGKCSSGEIAEHLSLTPSNTSKVICSVERKGLIKRVMGDKDKRQMYFTLTDDGEQQLSAIKNDNLEIPQILKNVVI